jgi:hypothetical protein
MKRYDVEAENLQDAIVLALKEFLSEPDENYLDDSFEIDDEGLEDCEGEKYDKDEVLNKL